MAFHSRHLALAFVAVFVCSAAWGEDLRVKIAQMEKQQQIQEAAIDTARSDLAEKTKEIEKIKGGNGSGIVSKFLLQKKMREAQLVSKNLESEMKAHARLSQNLRTARSNLMNEIENQIKSLTTGKNDYQLSQLQQLQQLITEKDRLLILQQKAVLDMPKFNLASAGNDKEDLIEKLRVVEDLQKSMNQKIAFLKEELSEERSKEFLRNEVAHFIDEENFFGEQSFISSGLNRKDNTKNAGALALKKEASANTTTPQTSDPALPSDPNAQPSTTEPAAGAEATTTTSEATATTALAPVPQVTSQSTAFQQPQEFEMFTALSDQIQESIRDTSPKSMGKAKTPEMAPSKSIDKKFSKRTKRGALEQNLALSQKILSDLDILRQNLNHQLKALE